jgi:glycosyltransferase involved in cell wall biosynthesis
MNITVHTLAYNESLVIQFMIDHYRSRFPNCHIVVYDNKSTDKTVEIAMANNCEIREMDTGGVADEEICINIKNSCWKNANTDWVLVCDVDELLDISEHELSYEDSLGTTKIQSESWNMVNIEDNVDLSTIDRGWRDPKDQRYCLNYDKELLFNKNYVQEINYNPGCHSNSANGIIKNSNKRYPLLHYKYINLNVFVEKQRVNRARDTEKQRRNNWGGSCHGGDQVQITEYNRAKNNSVKILFDHKFIHP